MLKMTTTKMVPVEQEDGGITFYAFAGDVVEGVGRAEFALSDDLKQTERRASTELTREDIAEMIEVCRPIVRRRVAAYTGEDSYKIAMALAAQKEETEDTSITSFVAGIEEAKAEHADAVEKLQAAQQKMKGGR